ncbi:MAG: DUF2232 domain-containing protein [Oligoflexia bacterium]|nr:DUF2232 domain-containing protein [Oligoflexia bacterium]
MILAINPKEISPSEQNGNGSKQLALLHPFILLFISIILTISFVMSIFTPYVLALILLLYGRARGGLILAVGAIAMLLLGLKIYSEVLWSWSFVVHMLIAFIISEIIRRGIPPIKGVLLAGFSLVLVATMIFVTLDSYFPKGIQGEMTKSISELASKLQPLTNDKKASSAGRPDSTSTKLIDGIEGTDRKDLLDLLAKPDVLAQEVMRSLPFTIFVSIFLSVWINLGLLLRSKHLFASRIIPSYLFTIDDFLAFKTPELMVWPLIMVLALMLVGPTWWPDGAATWGKNLLFCFGIFYFFQGHGILVELLTALKIERTFRSLLIILTVITSYWILALIGLFDMWVDFRKLIRKKISSPKDSDDTNGNDG